MTCDGPAKWTADAEIPRIVLGPFVWLVDDLAMSNTKSVHSGTA